MPKKAKILIIEDEPAVSMMMVHLLTRAGCEVATAWDAAKGMELAEAGNFDLITLDVDLSGLGLNGFEICRRLKANPRLNRIPIVFVSGPCGQDLQFGFDAGAVDHIAKPFEVLGFASRILSHLIPKALTICKDNGGPVES
jgi:CheY-like chemotaxis protein